jgi:hypothetical protein
MRLWGILSMIGTVLLCSNCTTTKPDYAVYREHMPRSILVVPPLNHSTNIKATGALMSALTMPLAEHGYYVPPIAIVQEFLRTNGLPTAGEMHAAPIDKVGNFFDADAILYVVIREWRTPFRILGTETTVTLDSRLVDVDTGTELWKQSRSYTHSYTDNSSIGTAIVTALIQATVLKDRTELNTARATVNLLYRNAQNGLLPGPQAKK